MRLVDDRCLVTVDDANGSKLTIGECSAGDKEGWRLAAQGAGLVITSAAGKCAGLDANDK